MKSRPWVTLSTPKYLATAAALSAACLLTAPGPAEAIPPAPLAPACTWQLPAFLTIHQDNNIDVRMAINDNKLAGRADYTSPGGGVTHGNAEGALNSDGRTFLFIMRWDPGGQNNYSGQINGDGSISGTTLNERNATNNWTATPNATCVAPPPKPADKPPAPAAGGGAGGNEVPPPPPPPAARTATATADVDVYSAPGGNDADKYPKTDTFPGFLENGRQVDLVDGSACPPADWCHISGSNVPTGNGYAWGSFFTTP
ncbi:hypothetical protein Mycch_0436 [Mycolicibacterium chubuense NBB4]|uniref:Uncharacterized protein n=1 Tax=Mycolicibacterium chubuense (strain NBB4) TaxID=710421 RepID=I4BD99_MYCCN|nr:hypothetical protein [Mycolicibacterium chubuense]AFM15256.1 hypothetical protein Mycch_0436 [Mycolicibacterium chubuense NBB4]